ncbi:ABC transporter ATP-binding protein [Pseudooceanicola sp.]|uniref:ABC transporter ATP-binding protein n=1 Tax=Pseudooceanicola sp. TaxID=1914328 RepID=UPI0035170A2A
MLELRNITKRFPGVIANDRACLTVGAGEVHAILGENGAGKSTLMRILYGAYQPDEGAVLIDGEARQLTSQRQAIACGIGMIHQEFMLVQPMTVVENVILGLDGDIGLRLDEAAKRISALSDHHGLGIDPHARVADLPVGVQQRVEILKLLFRDARILVLDEPTAILTPQEATSLLDTLRKLALQGRAIIIVTHKLNEVMAVADRVTIMRDGQTVRSIDPAQSNEGELARLMVGRPVGRTVVRPKVQPGARILSVNGLRVLGATGGEAVCGVDLTVREGEIVGIAGVEGNGQSQLVEAITGLRRSSGGSVMMDGRNVTHATPLEHARRGLVYVPADRRHVGSIATLGIDDNAMLGRQEDFTRGYGLFRDQRRIQRHAQELVERFDVKTPHIRFPAGKLSGGNLQKVIMGREILRDPRLLVVEQPTRGLDIGAIEYMWSQLLAVRGQGKGVLLVSAELNEIRSLADRILVIHRGRFLGELTPEDAEDELLGLMMAGMAAKPGTGPMPDRPRN